MKKPTAETFIAAMRAELKDKDIRDAFLIWHNGNMAVVYPEFKGNKIIIVFLRGCQHFGGE